MHNTTPRVRPRRRYHAPQIPAWRRARPVLLAWVVLAGIAAFVLAIVVLHVTAFRHGPVHMSQFANTSFGPVWMLGISSFTVAGAALSFSVRAHLDRSRCRRTGVWMIWLAVVCAVVLAAVPMARADQADSAQGFIHGGAAVFMFILLGSAMMTLAPAFHSNPLWRGVGIPSLVIGILVNAFGITYLITAIDGLRFAGVAQRLMVVLIVAWSLLVDTRLLRVARSAPMARLPRRLQPRGADGRFVSHAPRPAAKVS